MHSFEVHLNESVCRKSGRLGLEQAISEYVTLVQLMDYLGNVNHAISVVGYWIFDSNFEIALVLNRESLDITCAPSVGEEQVATFETFLCAVRYIYSTAHLKKEW